MTTWSRSEDKTYLYLKPGELVFSKRPVVVTTVLGSCVSVTFFVRSMGLAAICHAMLPRCPHPERCTRPCPMTGRYAVCAIEVMVQRMTAQGIRPKDIEVKLFGGAALIVSSHSDATAKSMGRQNVVSALETISSNGLILKVSDVGGALGRKIIFDTATGEILLKRLRRTPQLGNDA